MGNQPSECNMGDRLRCWKCDKVLPPCRSFDDFVKCHIHGRFVYKYNGGEYYRDVGHDNAYECEYCFYKPIRDQEALEKKRREEERKRREQERREQERREQERKRQEEERREQERREQEKKRQEEERREQERKEQEKKRQEEEKREEERREEERKEQERKRREEEAARREAEEKRQEELNQKLQKSHQNAQKMNEKQQQLISKITEERQTKRDVFKIHLDDFVEPDECGYGRDEILEIISSKCSISISNLSLSQLTADQVGKILSVLETLLFDEWIDALPSLSTLQHAQVLITELCVLSLEISDGASLANMSNRVQSLVEMISQSANNVFESFLLTQALYLTLVHFFTSDETSISDVVYIAKKWSEELPAEKLFALQFLGTLTLSLESVIKTVSIFILKVEIHCFKLLLSTLVQVKTEEAHSESTEILLKLVQMNQWTPAEAMNVFKVLSEKYAEDASIAKVLTLVHVYGISPTWTDDSGHSLIQTLDIADPESFHQVFQKSLRSQDESGLSAALAELRKCSNLEPLVIDKIQCIVSDILQYKENTPNVAPFRKDSFKNASLEVDRLREILPQLCKAVFDTKGWWPTVTQMLRWCALVLTEKSTPLELVGFEEDPCVTAMFAAIQVCLGNQVDIVLSPDIDSEKQMKEWSDFYKNLEISHVTNKVFSNASYTEVYKADIVYGTIDDFVTDHLQYKLEVMGAGCPQLSRGFIIEGKCLTTGQNLKLSRLENSDALKGAAEDLQCLMGRVFSEKMELRHRFVRALFRVLHNCMITDTNSDEIVTMLQKLTGKELPFQETFVLQFFEALLKAITRQMETEKNRASVLEEWCFDILFAFAVQSQAAADTSELFQMVSNLVAQSLWTPAEALQLLEALSDCHHDEGHKSIMKILYLLTMYQVSSKWKDENDQSLLQLSKTTGTQNLILHLEKNCREEKVKSIDTLYKEISEMKDIDKQTLEKSYSVIKHVKDLIIGGGIENFTDVQRIKSLSHRLETEALQEILAILCNAVHTYKAERKWWPRDTQMISWCFLALSGTGKLLEMGTGEGKSCVIAMFAVLRALRGEKVDVVSTSSVLCQRDVKEWANFYRYFGITVDTNTDKTEDNDRKECYQKHVVYGTVETFAADHLRQTFEMKDVRPDRGYQCIIIDEVDSLLLDQGVQLTYLSSNMVSMQHLNVILAMIWGHVNQYGLLSTGIQTFVRGPPASFFKAIYDSIDTEDTGINDPMDILLIAEECNIVYKGFAEEIYSSEKDKILQKLKTVSQDALVDFFHQMEQYVHYGFCVYTLDKDGLLCLKKPSLSHGQNIQDLTFLVLEDGLCCPLYDSEEILINPIAECIKEKLQYTPCENDNSKVSIPGFLRNLVEKKVAAWVENAFLAMSLKDGQEYIVTPSSICPVDFKSTGIVELNKKWGDGLQQFLEIKHQIKMSTISTVTNYISNVSFFEQYQGKIYGTTGTLGSTIDMRFLQDLYPTLSACTMPSFNRKKLFEVKGTLKTSSEEWKSEIKHVVMAEISSTSYRNGRAALVICETINKAEEIYEELKNSIPGEIILYSRSDNDSLSKIDKELHPGDVIVATNLAGRGTDIKVSKEVNNNGGLFVVLSFLSENTRVELQAFGRTARKGKPGSAQVIMCSEHLQESYRLLFTLEEAKEKRDKLAVEKVENMVNDIAEMKLREELFSEYCKTLRDIYKNTDIDEQRAVVAVMNEFWGIWLQTKSEEIDQLKREELLKSLETDISKAKSESQSQNSPSSCFYHYIKFGNIALFDKKWEVSAKLFEKAMNQDASWAAIAFYNHAYCTIQKRAEDYITKANEDLKKAQESLKYVSEQCTLCLQFVKMSGIESGRANTSSLEQQLISKCNMLGALDKNISEAMQKLKEIKEKDRDAIAEKAPVFTLVSNCEEDMQVESYNLYDQGLKYIFSVKEEPRFPWGALAVLFLGLAQIIAGALLAVFTCGALAQVGMGLITEGISDCISGIESMVTGEFSWKSWAIDKAISIGISIIGFGVGKLIAKGFKACKVLLKGLGKQLKSMPKFLSKQAKNGINNVIKTNMKNVVKHTAKKMVEKTINYGLGKLEEKVISEILEALKNEVSKTAMNEVKSNMAKQPMGGLVDSIILSHLEDKDQFCDLMQNKDRKDKLLTIFKDLSKSALQPLCADLSWQNKLSSSISSIIDKAKGETEGTARGILTAIKVTHMAILGIDATIAVTTLSGKFFIKLCDSLDDFKDEQGSYEKVKSSELSASDTEMLKTFKQELAESIAALLADALVETFHQKFSSHMVSLAQDHINDFIGGYVRKGLKSDRTEEKLRAGQNNRYIAYMPAGLKSERKLARDVHTQSQSHAERIKNRETSGSILDIRVLSETTGTKVVILTEDSHGKLTKMQEVEPTSKAATQTVELIYRPRSAQHPDSYDVRIDNQTVRVHSEGKNCVFDALARGMKPGATEEEVTSTAQQLRHLEADALLRDPDQWEPFIKRKEWTEGIRGGHWFMVEGAEPVKHIKDTKEVIKREVGTVDTNKKVKKDMHNKGPGEFIDADHQPTLDSIIKAVSLNQNSKLAEAMFSVVQKTPTSMNNLAAQVKKNHAPDPSITSRDSRQLVAEAISNDDIVRSFKLTIISAIPRALLTSNNNYNNFQSSSKSKTRLDIFNRSFPQHTTDMVKKWYNLLKGKNVMTETDYNTILTWIQKKGYDDQNDRERMDIITCL